MPEPDDIGLLTEYARHNSEEAFTALVERHVNLVYSVALRSVGHSDAAEEIAQAVFIILAQKAQGLSKRTVLSGWLYQTTRLTAANYLRTEIRRQKREQEAYMQSILNEADGGAGFQPAQTWQAGSLPHYNDWEQIAPLLDDAMERLGEKDRNAIVLRFFENRNLREVGTALGASEGVAKMRVNRALEKLRKFFTRRGVTLSAVAIAGAVSARSVQAAPVGLANSVTAVALAKGATASISTLTLIKGALKIMAWTKTKTAIVVCAVAAAATTTGVVGYKLVKSRPVLQSSAIDEVQADDTIRSQVTVEGINNSGMTITSNDFQDAILHVDRITDGSGQPIQFTTRRDGSLWRYTETFNKPIPPGGKIVETEEGTESGLIKPTGEPNVYQYRTDIMLGYGDVHRVEVIRLPAGAVLLEKQPADAVETTNDSRIELRIDKIIPSGGSLAVSCRYRLAANAN